MCDICVMNSVKERMLSRRNFFKGTAAAGAAAALGATALPTPVRADAHSGVIDMTHTLHHDFPTWSGEAEFTLHHEYKFAESGYNLMRIDMYEHCGTHIDAPLHFSADGASVDEIPVSQLVAPLCVVDIAARAEGDADTMVTPDDLRAWIAANGDIPDNACVAMHSGWAGKVGSDAFRGFDGTLQHYPGFHVEAVQMLMEETGTSSIAVDTLSLDPGNSQDFATHYAWLPTGRFGIENVANLDQVPAAGATILIGAPKFRGGTGGQARIMALV